VLGSLGVLQERKLEKRRARAVAISVTVVVLLLLAPLLWEFSDSVVEGERLSDPASQLSIWAFVVCGTLLGAALVAGWWRKRQ
jgi:Kef-type K+ transport system membrane component KefB